MDLTKVELPEGVAEHIAALEKDHAAQAEAAAERIEALEAHVAELTPPEEQPDPLEKADPVIKERLEAQQAEIVKLREEADARDAAETLEKAKTQTAELFLNTAKAEDVAALSKASPEAWDRVASDLAAKNAAIEQSVLMKEFGRTGDGEAASAGDKIAAAAADIRKANPDLTMTQAKVKAREDNPELAAAERKEERGS